MTAPMPQPCSQWRTELAATHPVDLPPEKRAALEAHLASCPACTAVYTHYQRLDARIHRLPAPAPLEGLPPKLLALWAAEERKEAGENALATSQIQEKPMRTIEPSTPTPFPSGPLPPQRRFSRRFVSGLSAVAAILVLILLTTAVLASRLHNSSSGSPTGTPGTATPQTQNTTTPGLTGYPIKVYFSKFPLTSPDAVYPVNRVSPTIGVATFSIQLLIAGPTPEERSQGYFSELNSLFTGPSTCDISNSTPTGGPDFTLTLNMKGSTPQQGTATLQFCRATQSPGIGADARIQAEINATLKQFPGIQNVVILTQGGQCFGDESGMNQCLK